MVQNSNGIAPIRKEYIRTLPVTIKDSDAPAEKETKKQKKKGMNKNRESCFSRDIVKLCKSVDLSIECDKKDCKYLHSAKEFFDQKEPDIGPNCYNYDTFGYCKYGLSCRFASSHITEDLKNKLPARELEETVKNTLSRDLQEQIRRKNTTFPKMKQFMALEAESDTPTIEPSNNSVTESATEATDSVVEIVQESVVATLKTASREKVRLDFTNKTYLAPLTTVGNLPFRRICKEFGVDITCGEMAVAQNINKGLFAEWSLLKRHKSEDFFGVQIAGAHFDQMSMTAEYINEYCQVDFVDINCGCPIDAVYQSGSGSGLMNRQARLEKIWKGMNYILDCPVTIKMRTGVSDEKPTALKLIEKFKTWGVPMTTIHGRSRQQRYTKLADWEYIEKCAVAAGDSIQVFGNGDVLDYQDYYKRLENNSLAGVMIGRGALIKPWIFTEIKERKVWDISSKERLEMLKKFANYGLEHWGSDIMGVNHTRRFLCEWLSMLYRYIPVALLEVLPQKINERPPGFYGRDDLETLMGSPNSQDWVKITEIILGPAPKDFKFIPKQVYFNSRHKSNSYSTESTGY